MHYQLVWIAVLIVLVAGPMALALAGSFLSDPSAERGPLNHVVPVIAPWPLMVNSAVAYALAFNIIFFIQELFLVLPKALTPGLRPTLFHNNHTWSGDHPLVALWQGTGALAIIVTGLSCLATLPALRKRSPPARLVVIWLAYHGLIMGLAQIPVGALSRSSDVGMAMGYLGWSLTTKTALALLALVLIVFVALRLTRFVFELAATPDELATATLRSRFVFKAATVAAFFGTLLVLPFRVPRETVEVIGPPIVVAIAGVSWMQTGAWIRRDNLSLGDAIRTIAWPIVVALLVTFALFHLVLARGIHFFDRAIKNPNSLLIPSLKMRTSPAAIDAQGGALLVAESGCRDTVTSSATSSGVAKRCRSELGRADLKNSFRNRALARFWKGAEFN